MGARAPPGSVGHSLCVGRGSIDGHDQCRSHAVQDLPRLYIDPSELADFVPSGTLEMTGAQARYLGTVLRREVGAEVLLFNARDGEWRASIAHVRKDRGSFALLTQVRAAEPVSGPVLVFALLKRDATDLVVRMGTELGVQRFIPVTTERTNASRVNMERLEAIAIEAAEQCERLDVPQFEEPCRLADLLGRWPQDRRLLVAVERAAARGTGDAAAPAMADGDGLLIGPEGGLSDAEVAMILARPFALGVTLGTRILRADTAVVAGLARFALTA